MELEIVSRAKRAWNAFRNRDPTRTHQDTGYGYARRPDRVRLTRGNERSIATAVYNRIALDVSAIDIRHCRLDKDGRYESDINSDLNNCITLEANIDQTGRAFRQDAVMSMFDEGCVALLPTETDTDPDENGSFKIYSMRTAKVVEWYPQHAKLWAYNELTGRKDYIVMPKSAVAIIENPLYAVMNEPNSTMQRLIRKLSLLDITDENTASGKLDLIIQLPYVAKSEALKQRAEDRIKHIEEQLSRGKYGIAYADGTEKIVQLNRAVENNLMKQIEYLTNLLFSQLGITQSILDGTADEQTMLNYNSRTIEPIVAAFVDEMKRKFLSKTARSQGQSILFFRDPFKLVPAAQVAEIADKLTRNEIASSNEMRQVIGWKPSKEPKADQLVNSNIAQPDANKTPEQKTEDPVSVGDKPLSEVAEEIKKEGKNQNGQSQSD